MVGDHYVLNQQRSKFIYVAIQCVTAYALKYKFIKDEIKQKFYDEYVECKSGSRLYYFKKIYNPIMEKRKK